MSMGCSVLGACTVIVLAGGPARHPVYMGDLAGFGENNRLVLPHLRGVGKSPAAQEPGRATLCRSEERRVGKECRSRWSPYH